MKEVSVHPERLNDSISGDHLRAIAIFLTSWRKVATYLELSESDLDAVEREERDEHMKKLKALQKWKGKCGFKATYKKLVGVLLSLAMADVAEKVCRLLKGMYMCVIYLISLLFYSEHRNGILHLCVCMCVCCVYALCIKENIKYIVEQ